MAQTKKVARKPSAASHGTQATSIADDRQQMVAKAAYFRAERAGFRGDPVEHWLAAEQEIDARMPRRH